MQEINYPETTKHIVAHNNEKYIYVKVDPQNCFRTGYPLVEIFDTKEMAKEHFPQAFIDEIF